MTEQYWPTEEAPGVATLVRTDHGTYGIAWTDFPAMEARGGWSGPFETIEAAEECAASWGSHFEVPVRFDRGDL